MTLKKESCCLQPWYRIVRIVYAQTYPRKSARLRPLRHRRFHHSYGLWCNRLQGVNKSYVVVVSCCATDWSVDCVSTVISESTRTACRQETWRYMSGWLLFLYCVCKTFFWLYRSVGFEGNFMYAKKGTTSATECADVVGFFFASWQIISCLLCKFISPEVSFINLFANLRVFVVGLDNSSEFLSFFIEVSEEIWRKIKYFQR